MSHSPRPPVAMGPRSTNDGGSGGNGSFPPVLRCSVPRERRSPIRLLPAAFGSVGMDRISAAAIAGSAVISAQLAGGRYAPTPSRPPRRRGMRLCASRGSRHQGRCSASPGRCWTACWVTPVSADDGKAERGAFAGARVLGAECTGGWRVFVGAVRQEAAGCGDGRDGGDGGEQRGCCAASGGLMIARLWRACRWRLGCYLRPCCRRRSGGGTRSAPPLYSSRHTSVSEFCWLVQRVFQKCLERRLKRWTVCRRYVVARTGSALLQSISQCSRRIGPIGARGATAIWTVNDRTPIAREIGLVHDAVIGRENNIHRVACIFEKLGMDLDWSGMRFCHANYRP